MPAGMRPPVLQLASVTRPSRPRNTCVSSLGLDVCDLSRGGEVRPMLAERPSLGRVVHQIRKTLTWAGPSGWAGLL